MKTHFSNLLKIETVCLVAWTNLREKMGAGGSVDQTPSHFNHAIYQKELERVIHSRNSGIEMNNNNKNSNTLFDVLIIGHEESVELLDCLQAMMQLRTKPSIKFTRNVKNSSQSSSILIALTPNCWSSAETVQALQDAMDNSKRIVFVCVPPNESFYSQQAFLTLSTLSKIELDLGTLFPLTPPAFAPLFQEIEVISLRYEAWVIDSINAHIIESLGYLRRLNSDPAAMFFAIGASPIMNNNITTQLSILPTSFEEMYLKEQLFEGYAQNMKTKEVVGWYQITSLPSSRGQGDQNEEGKNVVKFIIQYLSQSVNSIPSFSCSHDMIWTQSSDGIWKIKQDDNSVWYTDRRWNSSLGYAAEGSINRINGILELTNEYHAGSIGSSILEQTILYRCRFLYHYCIIGVGSEIADTAATFANVLKDRAIQSRKPKIALLCFSLGQDSVQDQDEIIRQSGAMILFITPTVWETGAILHQLDLAVSHNIPIIMISQSDPRLLGHCNVPEVMKSAPTYLQSRDVLPFYRRAYEQNALLDYVFYHSGYLQAIPIEATLQDMWKTSSLDFTLLESKLLSEIDKWSDTSEVQLLQQGNWIYYEGIAQRNGTVWGWYQLDGIFNDFKKEFLLLINFQSQNPRSFPSYMKVTSFDWEPSTSSFRENTPDGHWIGTRDPITKHLTITNKYNDTILHHAMPFVYHYFLSHIQRECTDLCAFVTSELIQISKIGKKMRCWFDQKASQINKSSMYSGIQYSGAYVLFLSPSVFKSMYVLFELATAIELKKPIILIHNPDVQSKSYVDLQELMKEVPIPYQNIFTECKELITFASIGKERKEFMKRLVIAGGYFENLSDDFLKQE